MSSAPALSPELTRASLALARTLSAAARCRALYPADHPAVDAAAARLIDTLRDRIAGMAFTFGVTPRTLLVAGLPLPRDPAVAEAAQILHARDVLQLTFLGAVPVDAVHALLTLLATAADDLRHGGGLAAAWARGGHPSILVDAVDYAQILADRAVTTPAGRHDDIWRSLVNSLAQGRQDLDQLQQVRLLEISRRASDIGALAEAVAAPRCAADGSPLVTTQAATVLAVFRHLASIVAALEPERLSAAMRHIASATGALDPAVVLQMMQADEGLHDTPLVPQIAAAFDDETVARLLATVLARNGRASARLAQVFDTIAPDDSRKRRVLALSRTLLGEQDFGRHGQFRALWASMESLLLNYDERPYVSPAYQQALDDAAVRGDVLAGRGLPAELPEWMVSIEQDNVRALSVLLLTDLLRLEQDPARAAALVDDMSMALDDLLLAGDFANVLVVVEALRTEAARIAPDAARAALVAAGESPALRDAAVLLDDTADLRRRADREDRHAAAHERFARCCEAIGPSSVRALFPALEREPDTPAYGRARAIVRGFGADAAAPLAVLAGDSRWQVQRNAAMLLGDTASAAAVPALQALLRRGDPRVAGHAVTALAALDDPAAARALQTVLRTAAGDARRAIVRALAAERDLRVVPMLGRVLADCDPFGHDHQIVLDVLAAVRELRDERAVGPVDAVMRRTRWFSPRKARAFKFASVQALAAIGTPRAQAALTQAAARGDRLLRRAARQAQA